MQAPIFHERPMLYISNLLSLYSVKLSQSVWFTLVQVDSISGCIGLKQRTFLLSWIGGRWHVRCLVEPSTALLLLSRTSCSACCSTRLPSSSWGEVPWEQAPMVVAAVSTVPLLRPFRPSADPAHGRGREVVSLCWGGQTEIEEEVEVICLALCCEDIGPWIWMWRSAAVSMPFPLLLYSLTSFLPLLDCESPCDVGVKMSGRACWHCVK